MDRLTQIRGEAGNSRDSTLDTTSPPSEAYMTANESSSKYFSLSEVDSTFDISSIKDDSLVSKEIPPIEPEQLISNLSPISKSNDLLGKQIEAANILSGGVNIFDDNENSYDGDELVIDDNVETEDDRPEVKSSDAASLPEVLEEEAKESKDTEVVLQIDGKNVDAIDIGNGLYLYRKEGQEELAAVQIVDDEQHQPSFKFLKVRENAEGNLEVYEEIEIEVPKEMPVKVGKVPEVKPAHVPIKDIGKVITDPGSKAIERKTKPPQIEALTASFSSSTIEIETNNDIGSEKTEFNFNGKLMKISDARKSPLVGSFTPMTFHSTPNKEGVPLTKTMVNQQLQPSRGSDNVKKTIEVHTDSKIILVDTTKSKDVDDERKKGEAEPFNNVKESDTKEMKTDTEQSKISTSSTENHEILQESKDVKKVEKDNVHMETPEKATKLNELVIAKDDLDKSKTNFINHLQDAKDDTSNDAVKSSSSELNKNQIEVSKDNIPNVQSTKLKIGKPEGKEVENVNKNLMQMKSFKSSEIKWPEDKKKTERSEICENIQTKKSLVKKETESKEVHDKILCTDKVTAKSLIQPMQAGASFEIAKRDISPAKPVTTKGMAEYVKTTTSSIISTDQLKQQQHDNSSIKHSQESNSKEVLNHVAAKSEMVLKLENETKNVPPEHVSYTQSNVKQNDDDDKVHNITNHPLVISAKDMAKDFKHVNSSATQQPVPNSIIDNAINNNLKSEKTKPQNPETKNLLTSDDKMKEVAKDVTVTMQNQDKKQIKSDVIIDNKTQEAKKVEDPEICIKPSTSSKIENIEPGKEDDKESESKSENNNQAVPFGKWTEANRQEFLNKIKETKVPATTSNTQQLKQTKDLNRRDVLKKIDSQRQSNNNSKMLDAAAKPDPKNEKTFGSKSIATQESKDSLKTEKSLDLKKQPSVNTNSTKVEICNKPSSSTITNAVQQVKFTKKDQLLSQRKGIANQQLIESVINRAIPTKLEDITQCKPCPSKGKKTSKRDVIEMKMNELHGIPFIERPSHQLPKVSVPEAKKAPSNKITKIPNLVPYSNKNHRKIVTETVPDIDSDEEIIEHEPVTGDTNFNKRKESPKSSQRAKPNPEVVSHEKQEKPKKDAVITEKDFDKFARRNSFTYENSLTVNFQSKDSHNKQTSGNEAHKQSVPVTESKVKPHNHLKISDTNNPIKLHTISKVVPISNDQLNKNYPSKVKMAYQSALTAKHQMESPNIIEDKPVKVVFMESNSEFTPRNLNSQGQKQSPTKKVSPDSDNYTCDSLDSEISAIDTLPVDEAKSYDVKNKSKHQRKQVLTPVETPELELIEPRDLGIEVSPKKKRRTDDIKLDKSSRSIVPKKTYLLNRSTTDAKVMDVIDPSKNHDVNITSIQNSLLGTHKEPISALDNLVKAAELIENQAVNNSKSNVSNVSLTSESNITINSDNSVSTPVKRGRGRPRKNPMNNSNNATETVKAPSPQKRPRLIDAKPPKYVDTEEDDSTDDDLVLENWTMGKINENIVCPICSKLFRSENVVFKHVKHCTGPSPNRSDSGKRSPRCRSPQESDSMSQDSLSSTDSNVEDKQMTPKETTKNPMSRELPSNSTVQDIIIIEDTPIKEKPKVDTLERESRKTMKPKIPQKADLVCEICGKTFRQLSYLVNHKIQHNREVPKKTEDKNKPKTTDSDESKPRSIFSCEVCHKEFRKLHHLVQHRLIHNQSTFIPSKSTRKTSSEQEDNKTEKPQITKQSEDQSAGFRCEPCDKSFRKLHHLVEHRETHDCINRQKNTPSKQVSEEKPTAPPQCDVCKKTFRKLHHLIEHREQHMESSEKSDDKSALSTKDIIHECSTCYMVFPNEHSLNRHSVICLRKKRQSASKTKPTEECETIELDDITESLDNAIESGEKLKTVAVNESIKKSSVAENLTDAKVETSSTVNVSEVKTKLPTNVEAEMNNTELKPQKSVETKPETKLLKSTELPVEKVVVKPSQEKVIPKKKAPVKLALTVTKRQSRSSASQLRAVDEIKSAVVDSSDDDEIRYMLNPDYKEDSESKLFMKVRANKRNSLQIERPNSKDLVKRRISLQHPPKNSRLKQKPVDMHLKATSSNVVKTTILKSVPSTDSDDSDVKYSFPKDASEKSVLTNETVTTEQKPQRKSLAQKRKSLGGIAKRKSIGKSMTSKHLVKPTPLKQFKKRISVVEHRCDCGQLFSSAALLSRHTSAAHTPPRIRRHRSPPPEPQHVVTKPRKTPDQSKSASKQPVRSEANGSTVKAEDKLRISEGKKSEDKAVNKRKSTKLPDEKSSVKSRRSIAHRGVPVPEKMRKLEKSLK